MAGKNDHRRLNDMVPVTNKDWNEKKKNFLGRPTLERLELLPKIRNIPRLWKITINLTMANNKYL